MYASPFPEWTPFIIISASAPFGWVLAKNNIPMILANAILSISSSKFVITFFAVLLLIILERLFDFVVLQFDTPLERKKAGTFDFSKVPASPI